MLLFFVVNYYFHMITQRVTMKNLCTGAAEKFKLNLVQTYLCLFLMYLLLSKYFFVNFTARNIHRGYNLLQVTLRYKCSWQARLVS